jgi:hypothetical protein
MSRIEKFNEFIRSSEIINKSEVISLIESAELTNSSDPILISKREQYRNVVKLGKSVLSLLIERKSYIWNIALKEITGVEPIGEKSSEITDFWVKWGKENGY